MRRHGVAFRKRTSDGGHRSMILLAISWIFAIFNYDPGGSEHAYSHERTPPIAEILPVVTSECGDSDKGD
jgi:hypothetical protein